jgi:hypothetical protein
MIVSVTADLPTCICPALALALLLLLPAPPPLPPLALFPYSPEHLPRILHQLRPHGIIPLELHLHQLVELQ